MPVREGHQGDGERPDRRGVGSHAPQTVAAAVREIAARLGHAGIDDPLGEARRLVAAACGIDAVALIVDGGRQLVAAEAERIEDYAARRAAHAPLSRILGERWFHGRPFALSAGTLDPRCDTETVVELALDLARQAGADERPLAIADVGTGSGAILVTMLAELPLARGFGIDISVDALATARRNAITHGVEKRARFEQRDIADGLPGTFDVVVSNPPYIPSGDIAGLAAEVRLHDPIAALDGGADGLVYFRLLVAAADALLPGGWLVVEVGAGQADDVARLMRERWPGGLIRTACDLGGHTRAVAGQPLSVGDRE